MDGRWWMTFADGRPFHPWVLGEQVIHPCAEDTYRGLIERPGADELIITWQVDGPAKDHLIVSRLRRQPQPTTSSRADHGARSIEAS